MTARDIQTLSLLTRARELAHLLAHAKVKVHLRARKREERHKELG